MPDHDFDMHCSFNLRLTRNTELDTWRITLYDAQTGSTLRFSSLEQLNAFLRIVMRSQATDAPDAGEPSQAST